MIKNYSLSNNPVENDPLSKNIYRRRSKLYDSIILLSKQNVNDGIAGENIVRILFDGVNLNHLSKNHPHVDIAIINGIDGVVIEDEIISVKSSLKLNSSISSVISDTKSIKLESLFSYVLFSNFNFNLTYESLFFRSKSILNKSIISIREGTGTEKNYKAAINITFYYLMFKNSKDQEANFAEDIERLSLSNEEVDYDLMNGKYSLYSAMVESKINRLDSPISLAGLYLDKNRDNLTCILKKTNTIPINTYWYKLLEIWIDNKFFDTKTTKYLSIKHVKKLFNITDFPIEIRISIGDYTPPVRDKTRHSEDRINGIARKRGIKKTNKLYVATKFRDADFKNKEIEVNDFFKKTIDILEKEPRLILNFSTFLKTLV